MNTITEDIEPNVSEGHEPLGDPFDMRLNVSLAACLDGEAETRTMGVEALGRPPARIWLTRRFLLAVPALLWARASFADDDADQIVLSNGWILARKDF